MRIAAQLMLLAGVAMVVLMPMNSKSANPLAASNAFGLLLVANKGEHSLGIVDPDAGRQLATVPEEGITGHEVIASPDGRTAYVPIYGNAGVGTPGTDGRTLAVIDIASRRLT